MITHSTFFPFLSFLMMVLRRHRPRWRGGAQVALPRQPSRDHLLQLLPLRAGPRRRRRRRRPCQLLFLFRLLPALLGHLPEVLPVLVRREQVRLVVEAEVDADRVGRHHIHRQGHEHEHGGDDDAPPGDRDGLEAWVFFGIGVWG